MDGLDINTMSEAVEKARLISNEFGRGLADLRAMIPELEVAAAELAASKATFDGELDRLDDDLSFGGSI